MEMSRQHIYNQKAKSQAYIDSLDNAEDEYPTIELTPAFCKRVILSLTLDCGAPIEGTQRFFNSILNKHVSTGYISGVLAEASRKAQAFDDSIDLSEIKQGANDEIFQGNSPILTGIDLESTYIYLLEESPDRKAESWELYMDDRKDHGLKLDVSVNDGGTGLIAGIKQAFPEADINFDVFHAMKSVGEEVMKIERKTYALIKEEYELDGKVQSGKARSKTVDKLEQIRPKVAASIKVCDILTILFAWLRELLGFSGYSFEETVELLEFILQEMSKIASRYPKLLIEIETFRKNIPSTLSYIRRLYREMDKCADESDITPHAFHMMYKQLTYKSTNEEYQKIEYYLVTLLMQKYDKVRDKFRKILGHVKKASSLVENLNGRIRAYVNIKRVIPARFFILMKVYFNTKRYSRSRCGERVGKSPLELLTGQEQPEFLEALGY